MRMTRRLQGALLRGLVLALLFMQLATSAYACTLAARAGQGAELATAAAAMVDCEEMSAWLDADLPHLCKSHCGDGHEALGTASVEPAAAPLLAWLAWHPPLEQYSQVSHRRAAPHQQAPPGAPLPNYIAFLVLRN